MARRNLIDAVRELKAAQRGGNRPHVDPHADENESYLNLFERLGGTVTSPTRAAALKEARQLLDGAFTKLPEAYRTAISAYDLAGCSAADAAEACGCSEGAMHMRRNRAMARLRDLLENRSVL